MENKVDQTNQKELSNDDLILDLKQVIKTKRKNLIVVEPKYKTNLTYELFGQKINGHVLNKDGITLQIGILGAIQHGLLLVTGSTESVSLGSYFLNDYVADFITKLSYIEYQSSLSELTKLEQQLESKLSEQRKTSLEIETIKYALQKF